LEFQHRGIVWARPQEFYKGKSYCVFDEDIRPEDIKQGELGDCYFLSSISALAERPSRIKKIFLSRDVQPTGCYCVALCVNGVWEEVIIDDLIPCKDYSYGKRKELAAAYSQSNAETNELWVMLLEKAYAKVFGGYSNIIGGQGLEALKNLTGAPTEAFKTLDKGNSNSSNDHWINIIEAEDKYFIMTASTRSRSTDGMPCPLISNS
jgi:calpain-15